MISSKSNACHAQVGDAPLFLTDPRHPGPAPVSRQAAPLRADGVASCQRHYTLGRHAMRPFHTACRISPLALLCAVLAWLPPLSGAEKPNIIVIMADDLGYGDLSCYGAKGVQTPAVDQLAREGVRFTSGYCGASTCTPSRYSLLTGTYAFRQ